jgi:hypothetical protein
MILSLASRFEALPCVDGVEVLVSFQHDERCLQARVSPQQNAFQVMILEHGRPVSKPLVFGPGMVGSSREAAESTISFVQHRMLELSALNT